MFSKALFFLNLFFAVANIGFFVHDQQYVANLVVGVVNALVAASLIPALIEDY